MTRGQRAWILVVAPALWLAIPPSAARAQDGRESDPGAALAAALGAACRANEAQFATYLTAENAAAFRALPAEQRTALLKRFSLADGAGKPLSSSDAQGHLILRCQAPEETVEFRFGDARTHENLAFLAVNVVDSQQTEFGLVRENGGWRLLSLGLVSLVEGVLDELTRNALVAGDFAVIDSADFARVSDLTEHLRKIGVLASQDRRIA